jgi:hypothetical protein
LRIIEIALRVVKLLAGVNHHCLVAYVRLIIIFVNVFRARSFVHQMKSLAQNGDVKGCHEKGRVQHEGKNGQAQEPLPARRFVDLEICENLTHSCFTRSRTHLQKLLRRETHA